MTNTKALDALIRARTNLVLDHPFFGTLALRLTLRENSTIPTCGTDGTYLYYNPDFVLSITPPQLCGVVGHEVLHCSNGHPWREGRREHVAWNHATDYAINPSIIESKLELPPGALIDAAYYGLSAEEIYDKVPKDNESNGCGIGEVMAPGSGEAITGVEANTESDWRVATVRAAQAAKMHGKLPASLERLIDGIVNPKVDWRATLQHLVQQALAKDDYSWRMPNSRYVASGLYLPSLRSERIPPMIIVVDTSGSIGSTELSEFSAEINAIAAQCKPESIVVIYCDARVNRIEEYEPGDYIELKPVGGGGTDFKPAFTYVEDQALEPCVLIYLTDMYGSFPECAPEYPVIWASTTDQDAPFGSVVNIK